MSSGRFWAGPVAQIVPIQLQTDAQTPERRTFFRRSRPSLPTKGADGDRLVSHGCNTQVGRHCCGRADREQTGPVGVRSRGLSHGCE
jgi:hypothetical protein